VFAFDADAAGNPPDSRVVKAQDFDGGLQEID